MNTHPDLAARLKHAGLRLTPQRLAICEFLRETRMHPTAAQIHQRMQAQFPSLSLMTVYNTLNSLVELGVINALGNAGDEHVHFDADTTPHINLACISCHNIIDIKSKKISDLASDVRRASGYRLQGARMMYYGICPDCQKTTS